MYRGSQLHYKQDICLYLLTELLLNKKIDVNYTISFTGISRHTLVRYIASIKNALFDFGCYNLDIFYDRKYSCYRCIIL